MTELLVLIGFFAVTAAAYYFKTLDADFWHAWRTPVAAGIVAGVLLWFLPHPIAIGVVLSAAALYVRLTGHQSEPIDGMLLGGVTGAAAAAVLVLRSETSAAAIGACIAAGAVAGYGTTFAAKRIVADVVTVAAAIAAAYAPLALAAAGLSIETIIIGVAALVPLLVVAAVFQQWPEIRAELRHEASLGFLDDADVRRTAHPILRHGGGGWTDRHAHREFVRLANEIALRKRRQRFRSDDVARLYQLEIMKLRMQIQEMSRIDRAVREGSDTMSASK